MQHQDSIVIAQVEGSESITSLQVKFPSTSSDVTISIFFFNIRNYQ